MDYDADGTLDMISGCYDPGDIFLFRGLGRGKFAKRELLVDEANVPLVHHPKERATFIELSEDANADGEAVTQARIASFGSWPSLVDWDADGDLDMLIGDFGGRIVLRQNTGTRAAPVWSPEAIPVHAGDERLNVGGHADPVAADWDNDGLFDLVVGDSRGGVHWYRNVGKSGKPKFAEANVLVERKAEQKFVTRKLQPREEAPPGVRAQICVVDYDLDGALDLIVGDYGKHYRLRKLSSREEAEFKAWEAELEDVVQQMQAKQEKGEDYSAVMQKYMKLEKREADFYASIDTESHVWLFRRRVK